jgi:hypothetical protein
VAKYAMSSHQHLPSEDPDRRSEPAEDFPWDLSRLPPAEAEELRAAWQSYSAVIAGLDEEDAAAHPEAPGGAN